MRKQPADVEWHIAESDAEWEAMKRNATPSPTSPKRPHWGPLLLLVLLLSGGGWLWHEQEAGSAPAVPAAPEWGTVDELATPHFVFHFFERDAATVATVGPQLERFYKTLQQDMDIALPIAPSIQITVNMTRALEDAPYHPRLLTAITVPSPTLYPSSEWRADELLAQALALPLLDHTLAQTMRRYEFTTAREPLLDGVRLWQLWETDLPLARWKPVLIRWIYVTLPAQTTTEHLPLPADYAALCAAHRLWMAYPVQLQIPLMCQGMDESPRRLSYSMIRQAPSHLPPLDTPIYPDEEVDAAGQRTVPRHPGYAIAVATVIDYVNQRYGRTHVPQLVAAWGSGVSWEVITPALFGLTAAEFERDWQTFLNAQE